MSPLRQKMIDTMQMHGFSPRTYKSYQEAVTDLVRYYKRSPEHISIDEIERYFKYLVKERHFAPASCRLYLNAIRFLYLQVLGWTAFDVPIQLPKRPQRIPELLTHHEVGSILSATHNPKHYMLLQCCYGCGLRVSELVNIQVRHIDGERHLLRVEQGKGRKDRYILLGDTLLHRLRVYWQAYRPDVWLFCSDRRPGHPICATTAQKVFTAAKREAGIVKVGGIHSLRHAYATHQLEAGTPVHRLQQQLGHQDINSTLRYVHWIPNHQQDKPSSVDLIAALEVEDE